MLDFVYSSSETLDATTNNAVALRSLARYFGCPALMRSANQFIQKDLTEYTAVKYLQKANKCNDENLEESVRKLILENYYRIPTALITTLPVDLFRSIVCSPGLDSEDDHLCVSIDIRAYFETNPSALSARLLNELTNNLSVIDFEAAEPLMKMVEHLDPNKEDKKSLLALDELCKLCAKSLSVGWEELDTGKCKKDFAANPCVQGRLVVPRLASALDQAKVDHSEMRRQISDQKWEIRGLEAQIRESEARIRQLEARNAELELLSSSSPLRGMDGSYRRLRKRSRS